MARSPIFDNSEDKTMATANAATLTPSTSKATIEVSPVNGPQVSTEVVYKDANDYLPQVPVTLADKLTDLARDKFAREIIAGHTSDKQMAQFRLEVIKSLVDTAHKQVVDRRKAKTEAKSLAFFRELRARGITIEEASKMAGINL